LSFSRFLHLPNLLVKARREEADERFTLAAFVGWQLGAGGKKTFGEYLYSLGLSDKPSQGVDSQKQEDMKLSRMGIEAR